MVLVDNRAFWIGDDILDVSDMLLDSSIVWLRIDDKGGLVVSNQNILPTDVVNGYGLVEY